MNIATQIASYKRYLKRRNCTDQTIRSYFYRLKPFARWLVIPTEKVTTAEIKCYIDFLLEERLEAHSINCHLSSIRRFYDFLIDEEEIQMINPVVIGLALRVPHPLPLYLKDVDIELFLQSVKKIRDKAMFMLMLRCGLRVDEVANLTLDVVDYQRSQILVSCGKGSKDRIVYISDDSAEALATYLDVRPIVKERRIFLVEKGTYKRQPISVRGIQKRMEYYSKKCGIPASCHRLRHTMATQLLNADADLVSIQDILGHSRIKTTQRYSKLSNLKAQRDYFKAMDTVMERTSMQSERLGHVE